MENTGTITYTETVPSNTIKYLISTSILNNIAESIRSKTGGTEDIAPIDWVNEIDSIEVSWPDGKNVGF